MEPTRNSNNGEPRGFCRVCRKRQPLKWRPECVDGPSVPPAPAAAQPAAPAAPAAAETVPAVPSKVCDLLGNEIEQHTGARPASKPADVRKKNGDSPASFWFVCGVCGSGEIDIEYVSMEQAMQRNRAASSRAKH